MLINCDLLFYHAPLKVQQKYLPMMREAVAKKQANTLPEKLTAAA